MKALYLGNFYLGIIFLNLHCPNFLRGFYCIVYVSGMTSCFFLIQACRLIIGSIYLVLVFCDNKFRHEPTVCFLCVSATCFSGLVVNICNPVPARENCYSALIIGSPPAGKLCTIAESCHHSTIIMK